MLLAHYVHTLYKPWTKHIFRVCVSTNALHVISFECKNNCNLAPRPIILMSEATFFFSFLLHGYSYQSMLIASNYNKDVLSFN